MPKLKSILAITILGGLAALAQTVTDGPGIAVDLGGAAVMHRTPVTYPVNARRAHVEGAVVLEVTIDSTGSVADARVLSGPTELRKSSILSVMQWHFSKETPSATRQVRITYQAPAGDPPPEPAAMAAQPRANPEGKRVEHITILGLAAEGRNELLSRLPVHEGDLYSSDMIRQTLDTIHQFDEHLAFGVNDASGSGLTLQIAAPGSAVGGAPKRITIGGNVQQSKLISKPRPVYPPEAKAARVQGQVSLQAVIAADGHVANLTVLSGDPLLVPSALAAVSQWVYQTTLLNGMPVEVVTQIDVNYTLTQ